MRKVSIKRGWTCSQSRRRRKKKKESKGEQNKDLFVKRVKNEQKQSGMGDMYPGWVSKLTGSVFIGGGLRVQGEQNRRGSVVVSRYSRGGQQKSLLQVTELCTVLLAVLLIQPRNYKEEIKKKKKKRGLSSSCVCWEPEVHVVVGSLLASGLTRIQAL